MKETWGTVKERHAEDGELEALMTVTGREAMRVASAVRDSRVPFASGPTPDPVVPVFVNGTGPYLFEVDPGAGFVRIDETLAGELELSGTKREGFEYTRAATGSPVSYARLDSLRVGGFAFADVPVTIERVGAPGPGGDARQEIAGSDGRPLPRGVLGVSLLSRTNFALDYPGRALVLSVRGRTAGGGDGRANGAGSEGVPAAAEEPESTTDGDSLLAEVPFRIYGKDVLVVDAMVDSSGPFPLAVAPGIPGVEVAPAWLLTALTRPAPDLAHPAPVRSGGELVTSYPLALREVAIGGLVRTRLSGATSRAPHAASHHFPLYGALCGEFFRPYRVAFDFDAMKLRLFQRSNESVGGVR
jgi:hypothetical protein